MSKENKENKEEIPFEEANEPSTEDHQTKKPSNNVGGFWKRESAAGNVYYSGILNIGNLKIRLNLIPNAYKEEGDEKPDFVLLG